MKLFFFFLRRLALQVSHIGNVHVASGAFAELLIESTLVQLSVWFPSSRGALETLRNYMFSLSATPLPPVLLGPFGGCQSSAPGNRRWAGRALEPCHDPSHGVPSGVIIFNDERESPACPSPGLVVKQVDPF